MTSELTLPQLDGCAGLYLDVWDLFGEQSFEADDVPRRFVEHDRDISHITGSDEPQRHLDLLVAYGLLEQDDDGWYRIRCLPNESVEEWQRDLRPQLEAVYRRVHRLERRRTGGIHDDEDGTQERTLIRRDGAAYVSSAFDGDATVRAVGAELTELVDQHPDATGIVLRAPADRAGEIQRLADRLCRADATADVDCPRFEKVSSDVVGDHKDDLEYRLYLQPTN